MESAILFYLKAWNRLINFCFLLALAQILAENSPPPHPPRPSIYDSPFPVDEQDTVGSTFPAQPDPTGKVFSPLAPSPPPQFPAFPITDLTKPIGD